MSDILQKLVAAFKGTAGTPGQRDFCLLFDNAVYPQTMQSVRDIREALGLTFYPSAPYRNNNP